jgi:hypothetical protein
MIQTQDTDVRASVPTKTMIVLLVARERRGANLAVSLMKVSRLMRVELKLIMSKLIGVALSVARLVALLSLTNVKLAGGTAMAMATRTPAGLLVVNVMRRGLRKKLRGAGALKRRSVVQPGKPGMMTAFARKSKLVQTRRPELPRMNGVLVEELNEMPIPTAHAVSVTDHPTRMLPTTPSTALDVIQSACPSLHLPMTTSTHATAVRQEARHTLVVQVVTRPPHGSTA